jgi:hypothetical protein
MGHLHKTLLIILYTKRAAVARACRENFLKTPSFFTSDGKMLDKKGHDLLK